MLDLGKGDPSVLANRASLEAQGKTSFLMR